MSGAAPGRPPVGRAAAAALAVSLALGLAACTGSGASGTPPTAQDPGASASTGPQASAPDSTPAEGGRPPTDPSAPVQTGPPGGTAAPSDATRTGDPPGTPPGPPAPPGSPGSPGPPGSGGAPPASPGGPDAAGGLLTAQDLPGWSVRPVHLPSTAVQPQPAGCTEIHDLLTGRRLGSTTGLASVGFAETSRMGTELREFVHTLGEPAAAVVERARAALPGCAQFEAVDGGVTRALRTAAVSVPGLPQGSLQVRLLVRETDFDLTRDLVLVPAGQTLAVLTTEGLSPLSDQQWQSIAGTAADRLPR